LVSVTGPEEAEVALAGGAALIDVKDPSRGSLGRADDAVIAEVVNIVARRCPVSAALGELLELVQPQVQPPLEIPEGVDWVKCGLAGCGSRLDWPELVDNLRGKIEPAGSCRLVVSAYADWRRANAPEPEDVVAYVLNQHASGLLIDTWGKDGTTLLDWMQVSEIVGICGHLKQAHIPIALSGALGRAEIRTLRLAQPNWFAVRGSACGGNQREGKIELERVQRLVAELI
jgi:uncharacterized protein (UPF0264 family)